MSFRSENVEDMIKSSDWNAPPLPFSISDLEVFSLLASCLKQKRDFSGELSCWLLSKHAREQKPVERAVQVGWQCLSGSIRSAREEGLIPGSLQLHVRCTCAP